MFKMLRTHCSRKWHLLRLMVKGWWHVQRQRWPQRTGLPAKSEGRYRPLMRSKEQGGHSAQTRRTGNLPSFQRYAELRKDPRKVDATSPKEPVPSRRWFQSKMNTTGSPGQMEAHWVQITHASLSMQRSSIPRTQTGTWQIFIRAFGPLHFISLVCGLFQLR